MQSTITRAMSTLQYDTSDRATPQVDAAKLEGSWKLDFGGPVVGPTDGTDPTNPTVKFDSGSSGPGAVDPASLVFRGPTLQEVDLDVRGAGPGTVGLLTTADGLLLEVDLFAGNKAETKTLIPVLSRFRDRYQASDLVVVADAGMLSAPNLLALQDNGSRFIVGSKTSKSPTNCRPTTAEEGPLRLLHRQQHQRELGACRTCPIPERGSRATSPTSTPRQWTDPPSWPPTTTSTRSNVPSPMTKSDLAARPVFHRLEDSTQAHLTIVFAALAISREAQTRTGLSINKILKPLRPLRSATVTIGTQQVTAQPRGRSRAEGFGSGSTSGGLCAFRVIRVCAGVGKQGTVRARSSRRWSGSPVPGGRRV